MVCFHRIQMCKKHVNKDAVLVLSIQFWNMIYFVPQRFLEKLFDGQISTVNQQDQHSRFTSRSTSFTSRSTSQFTSRSTSFTLTKKPDQVDMYWTSGREQKSRLQAFSHHTLAVHTHETQTLAEACHHNVQTGSEIWLFSCSETKVKQSIKRAQ